MKKVLKVLIVLAACTPAVASLIIGGILFDQDPWWIFIVIAIFISPAIKYSGCDKEDKFKEISNRIDRLERREGVRRWK